MDGHRACLQTLLQQGPLDCATKENLDPARDPDEDPRTRIGKMVVSLPGKIVDR
ncbi:hypothetical protein C1H46_011506 [Malus baccata]|uniref:Uncharacterized protein n=1 Tax=Malus baccata TaxID=106549 RepID=A0A540MVS1_MALBA|nr:hypothetical protein C1H46_011506 [Malus baccata]